MAITARSNGTTLSQKIPAPRLKSACAARQPRLSPLAQNHRAPAPGVVGLPAEVHSDPNLGESGTLTGCSHYVQINCNLASINLPMVDDPPTRPQFNPNPVAELYITIEDGDIRIKLRMAGPLAQSTIVLGAKPVSAGAYSLTISKCSVSCRLRRMVFAILPTCPKPGTASSPRSRRSRYSPNSK